MVTIAPMGPEHCELAASWLAQPEINSWLTSEWRGQAVSPRMVAMMLRNRRNRLFMVRDGEEECGLVGFSDLDEPDGTAMIWYLLGLRTRGSKGIITGAVAAGLGEAFDGIGLNCVYAWIIAGNEPSRRVLENNGFHRIGRMRSSVQRDGEVLDRIYYDITAADFRGRD